MKIDNIVSFVSPSPELERKLRNTENLISAGNSNLVDQYVRWSPEDYVDLVTYYHIKVTEEKMISGNGDK